MSASGCGRRGDGSGSAPQKFPHGDERVSGAPEPGSRPGQHRERRQPPAVQQDDVGARGVRASGRPGPCARPPIARIVGPQNRRTRRAALRRSVASGSGRAAAATRAGSQGRLTRRPSVAAPSSSAVTAGESDDPGLRASRCDWRFRARLRDAPRESGNSRASRPIKKNVAARADREHVEQRGVFTGYGPSSNVSATRCGPAARSSAADRARSEPNARAGSRESA